MDLDDVKSLPRSERVEKLFDFSPFPYQAELLDYGDEHDVAKAAVKPGRQVGKTETGGAIAADRSLAGRDVMILGPFEDTVSEMMEAARNHLTAAEEKFSQVGYTLGTEHRNKTDWQFANGGRLRSRTVGTDGTQIRGKKPDVVIIDEDAYIKKKIHTEVIEPFFSTHEEYEYYLFSTPAGKSGYFYEKVTQDDSFYSPHWPSSISPLISDEWLEEKKEELDSQTFAQEYLGEFVEAADSYLPHSIVKPCVESDRELNRGHGRYLGVDPARKGDDRAVFYDIDESGTTWNIWSEETTDGPGFVGRLQALHEGGDPGEPDVGTGELPRNGYQAIVVEENAVGGFGADFAEAGLGRVIQMVTSSNKSKQEMYQRLKNDLESENLSLPSHRRLINQMTSLEYSYTQTGLLKIEHPTGGHDDFPDALALANAARTGVADRFESNREPNRSGDVLAFQL